MAALGPAEGSGVLFSGWIRGNRRFARGNRRSAPLGLPALPGLPRFDKKSRTPNGARRQKKGVTAPRVEACNSRKVNLAGTAGIVQGGGSLGTISKGKAVGNATPRPGSRCLPPLAADNSPLVQLLVRSPPTELQQLTVAAWKAMVKTVISGGASIIRMKWERFRRRISVGDTAAATNLMRRTSPIQKPSAKNACFCFSCYVAKLSEVRDVGGLVLQT